MPCQNCNSERVLLISGILDDNFFACINNKNYIGYIPDNLGIGWRERISFDYCLNCGQIQGNFPMPTIDLEKEEPKPEIKVGMNIIIMPRNIYKRKNRKTGTITDMTADTIKVGIDKEFDEKTFDLTDVKCYVCADNKTVEIYIKTPKEKEKEKEKENVGY